jgi:hypothetical protein
VGSTQISLSSFIGVTPSPGDYNSDGIVDAADYVVWRNTLGELGPDLPADGNGNLEIDTGDYDVWRANFRQTSVRSPSASFNLPEPQTVAMLVGAISALFGRGHR